MDKNTIIAIGLSCLVLVGSLFIQTKFIMPKQVAKAEAQAAEEQIKQEEKQARIEEEQKLISSAFSEQENTDLKEENIVVETSKIKAVLTNKGGDVISYKLVNHKDKETGEGVEMVKNITSSNRAFALSFGNADNPTINELFNFKKQDDYTYLFYRDFEVKDQNGNPHKITLGKRYTFKEDDYMFKMEISVLNKDGELIDFNGASYSLRTSPQIGPSYDKKNRYEVRQMLSLSGTKKNRKNIADKYYNIAYDWAGIGGKYFALLVKPASPETMKQSVATVVKGDHGEMNSQLYLSRLPVSQGAVNDVYYVYIGPRQESELIKYNDQNKNAWGLINTKLNYALQTSGFLSPIEIAMKWSLERIQRIVKNWGVAIIILTILLKIILFPIGKNAAMGSIKMQELQPKIKEIQAKYGNDQQKQGMEMQKLYKKAGYNPMSGCLPMVIQMFILFALYNVFNNHFDFRGAGFISGWIDDLSVGDSILSWNKEIPFISGFTMNNLRILPFVYTASQLLNGKITQFGNPATGNNSQMKFMTYGMPLMFFFLFYNVPSGLLLYWTVSNILQIGQQIVINRIMKTKRAELAAKNASKNSRKVTKK